MDERQPFTVLMRWYLFWMIALFSMDRTSFILAQTYVLEALLTFLFDFSFPLQRTHIIRNVPFFSIHLCWWFIVDFDSSTHVFFFIFVISWLSIWRFGFVYYYLLYILYSKSCNEHEEEKKIKRNKSAHKKKYLYAYLYEMNLFFSSAFYPFDAFVDSTANLESWFNTKQKDTQRRKRRGNHYFTLIKWYQKNGCWYSAKINYAN